MKLNSKKSWLVAAAILSCWTALPSRAAEPSSTPPQAMTRGVAQAGPFQVTLEIGPQAPHTGQNRFLVTIRRGGQPVTEAEVTLSLSMPTHKHSAQTASAAQVGAEALGSGGQYSLVAWLPMRGVWRAEVTVQSEADKATTAFRFEAIDSPSKHLGMAHQAGALQVSLISEPARPRVGQNRFHVRVLQNGQPVPDALVNMTLMRPLMRMPKRGTFFTLRQFQRENYQRYIWDDPANQHSGMAERNQYLPMQPLTANGEVIPGQFEASADLAESGTYEAHIAVQSGAQWSVVKFTFRVAKK